MEILPVRINNIPDHDRVLILFLQFRPDLSQIVQLISLLYFKQSVLLANCNQLHFSTFKIHSCTHIWSFCSFLTNFFFFLIWTWLENQDLSLIKNHFLKIFLKITLRVFSILLYLFGFFLSVVLFFCLLAFISTEKEKKRKRKGRGGLSRFGQF